MLKIFIGDFNARVGRRDLWQGTLGIHGLDERNGAGVGTPRVLCLKSVDNYEFVVTKKHHVIDLVIMRARQRVFCTDVRVMRGANCWSDHRMVRDKLRVKPIFSQKNKGNQLFPLQLTCCTVQRSGMSIERT